MAHAQPTSGANCKPNGKLVRSNLRDAKLGGKSLARLLSRLSFQGWYANQYAPNGALMPDAGAVAQLMSRHRANHETNPPPLPPRRSAGCFFGCSLTRHAYSCTRCALLVDWRTQDCPSFCSPSTWLHRGVRKFQRQPERGWM